MKEEKFLFQRENYILFGIGLAFIILGFTLMTGGGSDDPQIFNEELFNSQRIILSPLLIVVGFVIEVFAILRRPKS